MKPTLLNLETNEEFVCTGVPDVLARAQSVGWAHAPGGAARTDFLRVPPGQFALDLSVEGFTLGQPPQDVRQLLAPLDAASKPGRNGSPPPFLLSWGSVRFPVIVERLDIAYTRFEPAGFPTSARVRLHLAEVVDQQKVGLAVAGVVAAVAAPVRKLLQTMDAKRQSVERAARAFADGAKRQVEQVRSAVGRVERDARQIATDAERQVKKVESELKMKADALAAGVKKAGEDVKREVETRVSSVKAEGEKAFKGVEQEVKQVEQKAKGEAEQVVEQFKELPGKVSSLADTELKSLNDKLTGLVNEYKKYPSEALDELRKRGQQYTRELESLETRAKQAEAEQSEAIKAEVEKRRGEIKSGLELLSEEAKRVKGKYDDFQRDVERAVTEHAKKQIDTLRDKFAVKAGKMGDKTLSELRKAQLAVALEHEWERVKEQLRFPYRESDWAAQKAELERAVADLTTRTNNLLTSA